VLSVSKENTTPAKSSFPFDGESDLLDQNSCPSQCSGGGDAKA